MELEGPEVKRIKLEHSYAFEFELNLVGTTQIKEEDPLKLFPEDINVIKSENEDVVIKNEVLEDNANQNFEYFNLPSINEQFENHSESNSSSTLVANEGDICNDVTDCLESVDNCNIVSNTETQPTDPLTLVNNYEETVPKHIFLEFQKRYEKTIVDLASQNTNLVNQLKKLEKENSELNTGLLVSNKDSSHQASFKAKVLQIEVNKLKQELKAAKAKEKLLEMKVHMRDQSEEAVKRTNALLQEQFDDDVKTKQAYIKEINNLKKRLNVRDAQHRRLKQEQKKFNDVRNSDNQIQKDLRAQLSTKEAESKSFQYKCFGLTQRMTNLSNEFATLQSELSITKTNLISAEKALADSVRIRQILTERSIRLNKELKNCRNIESYKIKLQDTHVELLKAVRNVETLQKSLNTEKKKSLYLVKERDQLLQEQELKFKETQRELVQSNQGLTASRNLLTHKFEECKSLRKVVETLTLQVNLKEVEVKKREEEIAKKEEEIKKRVCEYCGF